MNALNPKEVKVIQMALETMIEDMDAAIKDSSIPFAPQSRIIMLDMLTTAQTALAKIALASGKLIKLDPYQDGDEIEFLTKES